MIRLHVFCNRKINISFVLSTFERQTIETFLYNFLSFSWSLDIQNLINSLMQYSYNMKNMMIRCLLLSILPLLACSQVQNYQERCIYYSETDNACRESPDQVSDYINIIININDQSRIRRTVYGGTGCSDWPLRYADRIYPGRGFYLVDHPIGLYMTFEEVATRKYSFGLLSSLILNETIKNPVQIYGNDHECTIFGDGTVHHYGSGNGRPPAEIYLRCVPTSQVVQNQKGEAGHLTK